MGPLKIAAERLAHDLSVALGLGFQLGSNGLQVTDIGRHQGSDQDEILQEICDKIYHET